MANGVPRRQVRHVARESEIFLRNLTPTHRKHYAVDESQLFELNKNDTGVPNLEPSPSVATNLEINVAGVPTQLEINVAGVPANLEVLA